MVAIISGMMSGSRSATISEPSSTETSAVALLIQGPPLTKTPDLTQIGSVGRCAAGGGAGTATDDQVSVGPTRFLGGVGRPAELLASRPPPGRAPHDPPAEAAR